METEFERLLAEIGWTVPDVARRLRINTRTAQRWSNGQNETPPAVLLWLRTIADYLSQMQPPEKWN